MSEHENESKKETNDNALVAEDIPLPRLQETVFNDEGLREYVSDLIALAESITVSEKLGPTVRAMSAQNDLKGAAERLILGQSVAAQVRYKFDEKAWCDTLMKTADGVKLVRIELLILCDSARLVGCLPCPLQVFWVLYLERHHRQRRVHNHHSRRLLCCVCQRPPILKRNESSQIRPTQESIGQ